jgi:hypothetical protein
MGEGCVASQGPQWTVTIEVEEEEEEKKKKKKPV